MNKTRVFVVDDSALVRQFMAEVIGRQPDMALAGTAVDPVAALPKMQQAWPDVIILDMEMPRMDGLTFLRQLMSSRPTPVVICSSLTEQGASLTMEALSAGAVAVFAKAKLGVRQHLESIAGQLVGAIREARCARVQPKRPLLAANALPASAGLVLERTSVTPALLHTTDRLVAIGTSTGGTLALEQILTRLPADAPALVIVQHMPEKFTAAFAERLNAHSQIMVREARQGDRVTAGLALIAPGGLQTQVCRTGAHYCLEIQDAPPVNRHKPSVDVLFRSVAKAAGPNALGIIMTGMGDDGARGLLAMRQAGSRTLAQDEASCVVFGMPKEAIRLQAVDDVQPLEAMPEQILSFARLGRGRTS
ncbi:chemotaxis response regulator protein-glutamate methylesterase [Pseudaeromonas sp. ZJS20]|uniref:protein-glutamate methylesterase/protein-glutamine glutaminase n=1 Tax=Pseudaeromonas aegiceratis TaxID=3153928 RepID=UPI00390C4D2E